MSKHRYDMTRLSQWPITTNVSNEKSKQIHVTGAKGGKTLSPPQRLLGIAGIGKIEGKKRAEAGERQKACKRSFPPFFLPSLRREYLAAVVKYESRYV